MAKLHFITAVLLCHIFLRVNGHSHSSILLSGTPSPTTSSPCEVVDVGAQVNITIYVRVSNCNGASHENVSSPEYRDLESNLKGNLTDFYTRGGMNFALDITLQIAECMGNYVKVVVTITFKLGIGFNITEDIKNGVSNNSLGSLPVNGTLVEVAFICQSNDSMSYSTSMSMSAVSSSPTSTFTIVSSSSASPTAAGQSTSTTPPSSNTVSPTSTSTPSSTTSPQDDGQSTAPPSITTVPLASTSTPSSATPAPANGQSTTLPSITTVPPTSTSTLSSSTPLPANGLSTTLPSSTTEIPTSTSTLSSTRSPPANGESTTPSSSTTVPPTSTSTSSSTTPPPSEGQSTSTFPPSSNTVSPTSTSTPPSTTSTPSESESTTPPSSTTVPPNSTSTSSSTTPPPSEPPSGTKEPPTSTSTPSPTTSPPCEAIAAQVNITLYVSASNCSGSSHENVSSPEYRDLERNLKGNLTDFYTRDGVNYALTIILQTTQCMGDYVKVVVTINFKLGIGFNITEDIKTEVSNNSLVSLPVNGSRTLVEVTFIDVGAQVNITIYVRVSNCSGASHENVSSPEYRELERNLKGNLTDFYTRDGVNYALIITLQTTECMGNYVKVVVKITFKLGIGFNIEEDIKKEVNNNSLVSLPVNGTLVEVAFICQSTSSILPSSTTVSPTSISIPSTSTSAPSEGPSSSSSTTNPATPPTEPLQTEPPPTEEFVITYKIKEGECDRVCCDGAGGPVKMIPTCNPPSKHSNCTEEIEEAYHCPGEPKDLCSTTCDGDSSARSVQVQCPSFALVGLLAVATFFK
ncbi:uncharacterized protein [Acropora muricata]|uniref:uncharacterized protein isoform X3 n=1 Tax=Acropora muricata TaxID=159855 RepID=UPI0034E4BA27